MFVAPQERKLPFPPRLPKEQVVNQLCAISNCCSQIGPRQIQIDTHAHEQIRRRLQADRRAACRKTQRPDRTLARSFKDIPTVIGEPAADKDSMHTGLLSAESTHLPALKHFNHLTANYSGAR